MPMLVLVACNAVWSCWITVRLYEILQTWR